jgi:hypothetical protein
MNDVHSKTIQGLAFGLLILFIGAVSIFKFFVSNMNPAYGFAGSSYNYNQNGYAQQYYPYQPQYQPSYNYRYNSGYGGYAYGYAPGSYYGGSAAGNYVAGYGQRGWSPYLMPSTSCNSLLGCQQNYVSHMYIGNALDAAYYNNPSLFAPRYMDNHQLFTRSLWPQRFSY